MLVSDDAPGFAPSPHSPTLSIPTLSQPPILPTWALSAHLWLVESKDPSTIEPLQLDVQG